MRMRHSKSAHSNVTAMVRLTKREKNPIGNTDERKEPLVHNGKKKPLGVRFRFLKRNPTQALKHHFACRLICSGFSMRFRRAGVGGLALRWRSGRLVFSAAI